MSYHSQTCPAENSEYGPWAPGLEIELCGFQLIAATKLSTLTVMQVACKSREPRSVESGLLRNRSKRKMFWFILTVAETIIRRSFEFYKPPLCRHVRLSHPSCSSWCFCSGLSNKNKNVKICCTSSNSHFKYGIFQLFWTD